jgi:hypothetical protein
VTTSSRKSPVSSSGPPLAGGDLRPSPGNSPLSDVVGGVPNATPPPRKWLGVALVDMEIVSEEQAGVGQRRNRKVQSDNGPATRVTDHEGAVAQVGVRFLLLFEGRGLWFFFKGTGRLTWRRVTQELLIELWADARQLRDELCAPHRRGFKPRFGFPARRFNPCGEASSLGHLQKIFDHVNRLRG